LIVLSLIITYTGGQPNLIKTKPILKKIKDGKKIAMKKKINIGFPILNQIYVFYLKSKF